MSADLQTRLQSALGGTYRLDKELGGGGMSRVFLAEEVELGRRVVIKVLPPEMGAGVNVERFRREIQLAAKLQHPHIVPLLTAGAQGDLLYYIMPFIEGESLRAKLAREGELPVGDAARILKEVLDALAYAHGQDVVHRDIKPDNVLLSGDHAVVMDFGVAKAVSASTGESSLTSLGVALGTPAYMAPEQAAADPNVDHRADLYAVGVLAYEMLSGRPPFSGSSAQAVLSAHMTQAPEPVTTHRATVPAALNELILRCLAKKPADRWQRARDVMPHLDALLTPSGGVTPTGTQPVAAVDYDALARQGHPVRVAALFGLAAVLVLGVVYLIMLQLGLPDWVFLGALALLAVGLPIMLVTGHHERRRALARTTGAVVATPTTGVERHFTWRRSVMGGGLAFAGLGVVAVGYMTMRAFGIGPAATLVSAGVLDERAPLVLADFETRSADSALGSTVTEALRIDLARSPVVTVVAPAAITEILRSMGRDPHTRLDGAIAREVAVREGAGGVVAGEVSTAGTGFVLSVQLVAPQDGSVLVAARDAADDASGVIDAIDRLSRKLRERIGESLKTIRAGAPLGRVSTRSLPALERYSQAIRASELQGDDDKAVALLEEAIALDTGFVMAYRKLGVILEDRGGEPTQWRKLLTSAYERRHRVTEVERFQIEGVYYAAVTEELERAAGVYRRFVEQHPDSLSGWNNLSVIYGRMREWALAEEAAREVIARRRPGASVNANLVRFQILQGKLAAAESTVIALEQQFPDDTSVPWARAMLYLARRDYDSAGAQVRSIQEANPANLARRSGVAWWLAMLSQRVGRLAEAERHLDDRMRAQGDRGLPVLYLGAAMDRAWVDVRYRGRPEMGLGVVVRALERFPLDSLTPMDRPYVQLAGLWAAAGRPQEAKRYMADYERVVDPTTRGLNGVRHWAAGMIALAEGAPEEAIEHFKRNHDQAHACSVCGLPEIAEAYDRTGNADSAIAYYRRVLDAPWHNPWLVGQHYYRSYRRLGQLYEARGDTAEAVEYYSEFVDLWRDADDELQPQVEDIRARIAQLVGER